MPPTFFGFQIISKHLAWLFIIQDTNLQHLWTIGTSTDSVDLCPNRRSYNIYIAGSASQPQSAQKVPCRGMNLGFARRSICRNKGKTNNTYSQGGYQSRGTSTGVCVFILPSHRAFILCTECISTPWVVFFSGFLFFFSPFFFFLELTWAVSQAVYARLQWSLLHSSVRLEYPPEAKHRHYPQD